jgi:hypothetical protein
MDAGLDALDAVIGDVGTHDDLLGALEGCTAVVSAISDFGLLLFQS